jgi:hypothetical protein
VTPLGRGVERAARTCAHSLVLCARAEEVACAALAVNDPYGQAGWDAVRWAHLLDRLARSHTRARLLRARLEAARLPDAHGEEAWCCLRAVSLQDGMVEPLQRKPPDPAL